MKFISIALLALFCLFASPSWAAEQRAVYVSVLPDIPVMEGFTEDLPHSVAFDKASGRVVQVTLLGVGIPPKEAYRFYNDTLQQLGWIPLKTGVFVRNGEQLLVESRKVQGGVALRLSLAPKTN